MNLYFSKKIISVVLITALFAAFGIQVYAENNELSEVLSAQSDEVIPCSSLDLPDDTDDFSPSLAKQALYLCSGHTADNEAARLRDAGYSILMQANYTDSSSEAKHTCAYTLANKIIYYKGVQSNLFIVAIRGTDGDEWYANYDFAPSHSDDSVFAENYLLAAENVFLGIENYIAGDPIVLVCGHSRGAACANILGALLNSRFHNHRILTYTFASPCTVRKGQVLFDQSGIFNIINRSDLVPRLPLDAWGFSRLGTDVFFTSDPELSEKITYAVDIAAGISPSISAYYGDKHSLISSGLSEYGISAYELFSVFSSFLINGKLSAVPDLQFDANPIGGSNDFQPLIEALKACGDDDREPAAVLLEQHMPYTYQKGLDSLTEEDGK